jgi:thiamine-phosphate pyrophosphorylase
MKSISGLYAVTPDLADTRALVRLAEAALIGGAAFLQYRNKLADEQLRRTQVAALRDLCRRSGAALIINDHVELAHEIGAEGVHVGDDDASIAYARGLLGRARIVGASCYNDLRRARSAQAQGADYVAFGSFFPSRVKPGAVRAPLALLGEAKREITVPVVAIGGITLANGAQLIAAGADALAVISALFAAADVEAAARDFSALFAQAKT